MADFAVDVKGLVKRYGSRVVAVDGLDLQVPHGQTYGLLGPNGAGKTTTIRMLLGLVRPTSGRIRVLGRAPGDPATLRHVGAMGETAFYPFLSGRDNLRVAARRARVGDGRVDAVLEMVSLGSRAGDPFGTFSLGMKQRLGVAAALLKDPVLMVLDEPSNGLDPEGQLAMRRTIQDLRADGRTILLSSHDMDEVELLCDRVGIVGGGRMLAEGTPNQLRGAERLVLRAEPTDVALRIVTGIPAVARVSSTDGRLEVRVDDAVPTPAAQVNRRLVEAGVAVSELQMHRTSLQAAFLALTQGRTAGADSDPYASPPGRGGRHRVPVTDSHEGPA